MREPFIKRQTLPTGNTYTISDYRGSIGAAADNPTITTLPTASEDEAGNIYNVISDGIYGGLNARVGDTIICVNTGNNVYAWNLLGGDGVTYSFSTGDNSGEIKVTPSVGAPYNVKPKDLNNAAYKDITDTYDPTSTDAISGVGVAQALATLPDPMVFKGTLGTGGTISTLPEDGSANIGDTYKVITDGVYAGTSAKLGDTFICVTKTSNTNTWVLIPSGDEPSGTVTNVATGVGLTTADGNPITSSGAIKAALKSETASALTASAKGSTASREYAVGVDANGDLSVNIPWEDTTYTATNTNVGSASGWNAGSTPTLGTDIDADEIDSWTANTPTEVVLPTYTVSGETLIITAGTVTAGTSASLSYTEKTIPNVTSVGTTPSLTVTSTSVVNSVTAD